MKQITLLFIGFTISAALLSCKNSTHQKSGYFHYNESSGIATLDPAFAKNLSVMWPVHQLYNTLVEVNDSSVIVPSLASKYRFSEDKKSIYFTLRTDVFFHDNKCFKNGKGRRLIAEDVVYSFNRIIDPTIASPGSWIFNDRVDSTQPFKALNDSVFVIKLARPFHAILGILSMQYCSVLPKEAIEMYGQDFRRNPVGTGPFVYVAWEEGQSMLLKKNANYFEFDKSGKRLPFLEGITINFYDSKATEFLNFQKGRLDFLNDIDPSFKDEVLSKTGKLKNDWKNEITLQVHPYLNVEYLGILMDTSKGIVQNSALRFKEIRQAINYSIDREKMMLYLRNSIGRAASNGFIPPGLPAYSDTVTGYTYNPEMARQKLQQAGYNGGTVFPSIKLVSIPIYANLASFIANELGKVGINVQVEIIQKSLLLQSVGRQEISFFRASWIADYPDEENYLSVFYSKNPAPPNYTRFHNRTYDRLYEAALQEENDSIRYAHYREMDRIIIQEAPIIPLWYDEVVHLVRKNIHNFLPNSQNMLELRRTTKDIN